MKRCIPFFLLLILSGPVLAQTYTAATYNMRLNVESDSVNRWDNRKAWFTDQVKSFSPDVMGTQEGLPGQISYLDSVFNQYEYAGVGREDGAQKGEYSAVFYNAEKFNLINQNTFWLSETPDKVSTGWDAALPRICTFVLLEDIQNKQRFWVFNTHFDHIGKQARLESAKLILEKINELNRQDYPVLMMGDLNSMPDSPPITFISEHMNDAKEASKSEPKGPVGTFNSFDTSHPLDTRIDYIFTNDDITIHSYEVINEIKNNRTPSDHLPVVVTFSLKSSN